VKREFLEETNISPEEYDLLDSFEVSNVIKKNEKNEILFHYVILQFIAILKNKPNKIQAGDDAEDFIVVTRDKLNELIPFMTRDLMKVIEKAHHVALKK
jgi:8-oxo-dGTP pyrophosphatase MutT (NUDIX family)